MSIWLGPLHIEYGYLIQFVRLGKELLGIKLNQKNWKTSTNIITSLVLIGFR